jgi:hypothetical protein
MNLRITRLIVSHKKNFFVMLLIFIIFFFPTISGGIINKSIDTSFLNYSSKHIEKTSMSSNNDVEYWALLIAVGVYYQVPDMNRPSMLNEVANFEQVLSSSSNWDNDHIKVIKAEDATVLNIFKGFKWLDRNEDENDISLIYLTTHGFPHFWDRPPFDEADHRDEALATYYGFLPYDNPFRWEYLSNPFGIILDDQFNYWFNSLESQGVGVIVDSCHSGGFNDYYTIGSNKEYTTDFSQEFGRELQGQNRIVVTSVPEEDVSYGSYFSHHLIQGFQWFADSNHDNIVTLEESFYYAENKVEQQTGMDPQIFDNYPGELPIIQR